MYTMCIAGTLVITTSCSENRTNDSRDVAEQENIDNRASDRTGNNMTGNNRTGDNTTGVNRTAIVIDNDNDSQFLMDAAEKQHEEIQLGRLAQQKGTTPHVKELGKMMEDDHTKSLEELRGLAQSKSVAIPTSATNDSRDNHKDLNDKTGNDFDKAFSDMMVDHHEDAIDLYEKAAEDSEDAEIRAWANKQLPGLKTHLRHAKASKDKSDNNN